MATVKELLRNKGGEVFGIGPDEPVLAAIRMMADRSVGALIVTKGSELLGIISERDYARKVILKGRSSSDTLVREIMSSPVKTVRPDDTVNTCMMVMTEKHIRHLPVVESGKVIGVLSIGDLVKQVIEEQQQEIEQLQKYIAS
jgi:CBS domain-containing protein